LVPQVGPGWLRVAGLKNFPTKFGEKGEKGREGNKSKGCEGALKGLHFVPQKNIFYEKNRKSIRGACCRGKGLEGQTRNKRRSGVTCPKNPHTAASRKKRKKEEAAEV